MSCRTFRWHGISLVACLHCVAACSSEPSERARPFESVGTVQTWATSASAVAIYGHAYEHLSLADGRQTSWDAECPNTHDDGEILTIEGGCTDRAGRVWTGTATVTRDGDDRALNLDAFNDNNGTFVRRKVSDARYEFEAHLVLGEGTTIDYVGSVEGSYDARTLWNGNGRVVREGGWLATTGEVDASTRDEVLDDEVCSNQPVSGSTTLRFGSDTAVIMYDGETDCDEEQNAQLTVNDEVRGTVSDVNCSVHTPGAAERGALAGFAVVIAGAAAARRRASRRSVSTR